MQWYQLSCIYEIIQNTRSRIHLIDIIKQDISTRFVFLSKYYSNTKAIITFCSQIIHKGSNHVQMTYVVH